MPDIRIKDLPSGVPNVNKRLAMDLTTAESATIKDIVYAGRPAASQSEAEAGINSEKVMTPVSVKQSIASEVGITIASSAQGAKADSAVQPGDLSTVATTGEYSDLSGVPTFSPSAASPSISLLRDASETNVNLTQILVGTDLRQGLAIDEVNSKIYTLHVTGTSPEVSWISQYNSSRNLSQSPIGVSASSSQLGHQGISIEYLDSGAAKLWGSVRNGASYPNGHRQAIRFDYAGNGEVISNVQSYTLFGPEFSFSTNSTMPSVSYDQRFLVAAGRKTSRAFTIRVWDLNSLISGGAGDYSSSYIYEWLVNEDILDNDAGGSPTPVQGIASDGEKVYILAGNSSLQNKRIHAYSLIGQRILANNNVRVGISQASLDGTYFEPEGIAIYRANGSSQPTVGLLITTGPGGAHKNYVWALGSSGLQSGKWVPQVTLITNASAASAGTGHFIRMGSEVSFAGRITIDPTATGLVVVEVSLPIPSDFVSVVDAAGTFAATLTIDGGGIEPNVTNNTLSFSFIASDVANRAFYYTGMYQIL